MSERFIVDEAEIQRAGEYFGGNNGYTRALEVGEAWKAVGMTPMYVWDEKFSGLFVYSEETYGKYLH